MNGISALIKKKKERKIPWNALASLCHVRKQEETYNLEEGPHSPMLAL